MKSRKLPLILAVVAIIITAVATINIVNKVKERDRVRAELKQTQVERDKKVKALEQERDAKSQELQQSQQKQVEKDNRIKDLEQQVIVKQAKVKLASKITTTSAPAPAGGAVAGCGDNAYANFIYMHESKCNPNARNASGCYGIGQACPGSKVAQCGADYACQNAWFTAYANSKGGWAAAYQFWLAHGWW